MPSYIPEHTYGLRPGTSDKYGLIPWPAHLTPRDLFPEERSSDLQLTKKGEAYVASQSATDGRTEALAETGSTTQDYVPIVADAAGVIFLAISNDRSSIENTIERLINMLDDLEPDADIEPSLGWSSSVAYVAGANDDREDDGDDREPDVDDEYSLGWQEEGSQAHLNAAFSVDAGEGEPDLGFVGHGTGWRDGEGLDDREQNNGSDDEREHSDGDETDLDGGQHDAAIFIPGGGSVSQYEDGWRAALGSPVAPAVVARRAKRSRNGPFPQAQPDDGEPTMIPFVESFQRPGDVPLLHKIPEITSRYELKDADFARLPWA